MTDPVRQNNLFGSQGSPDAGVQGGACRQQAGQQRSGERSGERPQRSRKTRAVLEGIADHHRSEGVNDWPADQRRHARGDQPAEQGNQQPLGRHQDEDGAAARPARAYPPAGPAPPGFPTAP